MKWLVVAIAALCLCRLDAATAATPTAVRRWLHAPQVQWARSMAAVRAMAFRARVARQKLEDLGPMPGSHGAAARLGRLRSGERVIVRSPRDIDGAMRRHNTIYLLA